MVKFKLGTFNVRGIGEADKRRKIFNLIHNKHIDIALLQETHSTRSCEKRWRTESGDRILYSHGTSNSKGVAILIKKDLDIRISNVERDQDGRYIIVYCQIGTHKFQLINCYAPNVDSPEFFVDIFNKIDLDYFTLIGGDFNTILSDKDIKGGKGNHHPKSTHVINQSMEHFQLSDYWRVKNDSFRYTWMKKQPCVYKRLDYIIGSACLKTHVDSLDIDPAVLTDHAFPWIKLVLDEDQTNRGKGYWKFNLTLLEDENYRNEIEQMIKEVSEQQNDIILRWEIIKMSARGISIKYGSRLKKSRNLKIDALEKKLKQTVKCASEQTLFSMKNKEQQITLLTKDLEELYSQRTKGAMLRSSSEWFDGGEKVTKYFFNMERLKAKRKTITKLYDKNGILTSDHKRVQQIIESFYTKLFTTNESGGLDNNYLKDIVIPQVTPEQNLMLNSSIMLEEIKIAMKQLNRNKSPGPDGFPIEWYLTFANDIIHTLHSLFLANVKQQKMHGSGRESIISLMDKLSKDILFIDHWRPLNLLNCDYKIYAKILANRLQMVTDQLISFDQRGFLKGRRMSDNIMELNTIIDYCQRENLPAIITAVDFRKAFDTVEWSAIQEILHAYGFKTEFIQMIMTCFNEFSTRVINNGKMSEYIKITRGTKQGCPISSLIFNLVVEIIAIKLRQCKDIQGINICGKVKITSQYADDLWTASKYNEKSFKAQVHLFKQFQKFTGLSVNYDKTEILRIGSIRNTDAKFVSTLPLKWSDGPVKILGFQIENTLQKTTVTNYNNAVTKMDAITQLWSNRSLTMLGRAQIINVLIMGQFIFRLACLPTPDKNVLNQYVRKVRSFIWNNKKARISYLKLIQPVHLGGIKLADLKCRDTSIKVASVKRLIINSDESLSFLREAWHYFCDVPLERLELCNIDPKEIKNYTKHESIVQSMIYAWCVVTFNSPQNKEDVLKQSMWYNTHIKVMNKVIVNQKLIEKGIVNLSHIFNKATGTWFTYDDFCTKYGSNLINFLDYLTLTKNIPKTWKQLLKLTGNANDQSEIVKIMKSVKVSKYVYDNMLTKSDVKFTARYKWECLLQIEITDKRWRNIITDVYTISNCTKLRWFQFRLLNHILTTNLQRSKWNTEISPKCVFCQKEDESIIHLFVTCEVVKKAIWLPLNKWLEYYCCIKIDIDANTILLNLYKDCFRIMTNTIILICKQYIYSTKCLNHKLSFVQLISKISHYKLLEKLSAQKVNRNDIHEKKWLMYDLI